MTASKPTSKIGYAIKGINASTFDALGFSMFWLYSAEELDRMVSLGLEAVRSDMIQLEQYCKTDLSGPHPQIKPSVHFVSLYLAALSIENLLKGALVIEHPDLIKNGKLHGDTISSHDLIKIAQNANIPLNSEEIEFCQLGTTSIESFGRYRLAKNAAKTPSEVSVGPPTFDVYRAFYNRLHTQIFAQPWKPQGAP
jgi:hypothetical protein